MLTWWFVGLAVAGAFCRALGSALQERDAISAPGRPVARFGLLLYLARRPRWLVGMGIAGVGMALHLAALSGASLAVIQPIGVSGLVFAVVLAALFNRRRVSWTEMGAASAVMVGLAGFVFVLVDEPVAPALDPAAVLGLIAGLGVVSALVFVLAPRVAPGGRALLLAGTAGIALGTASGFARVIAYALTTEPHALLFWLGAAGVGSAVLCGLLLQNAFRTGRFAAAYAAFLLCDSATGVGVGALLLGEPLPTSLLGQVVAAGAAACAIAGTVALATIRPEDPAHPRRRGHDGREHRRNEDSRAVTDIPHALRE